MMLNEECIHSVIGGNNMRLKLIILDREIYPKEAIRIPYEDLYICLLQCYL